ncbi:hypothetical protein GHT06_016479 [Daphnia sinensis]|uniref:Uncharacterized protein n=1 Tax=Daphnia sinensis TaxID=1820382 RepID=A0AAD5KPG1_9CRUS|nr:hypothetical protein GHT06_016479 [Daphnia sinensis]
MQQSLHRHWWLQCVQLARRLVFPETQASESHAISALPRRPMRIASVGIRRQTRYLYRQFSNSCIEPHADFSAAEEATTNDVEIPTTLESGSLPNRLFPAEIWGKNRERIDEVEVEMDGYDDDGDEDRGSSGYYE